MDKQNQDQNQDQNQEQVTIYSELTKNLQEVLGSKEEIEAICKARPLNIYWGTAPTGRIHLGYMIPMMKIIDFLKAGSHVTILFADIHAFLDSKKTSLELLDARTFYYERMITEILKMLGADTNRVRFVRGSSFQLTDKYTMDMYKMASMTTLSEAKHAGAEVVKQSDNPLMTGLMYPILQALDEEYLRADVQFGGIDQRKIFAFARESLPKLKYKKRFHFMTPMAPGLRTVPKDTKTEDTQETNNCDELKNRVQEIMTSTQDKKKLLFELDKLVKQEETNDLMQLEKMSSSNEDTKIDLLDTKNMLKKKIGRAYCLPGDANDNTPLDLLRMIVFPILEIQGRKFKITRKEEYGGDIIYDNYDQVHQDFATEKLHPGDLKSGLVDSLDEIIVPIRNAFSDREHQKLVLKAYPQK